MKYIVLCSTYSLITKKKPCQFQVNDVSMSTLSHGEAVTFLRRCGPVARLRLYRDHCGTPPSPSAYSPTTDQSDTTMITRPKPPLRSVFYLNVFFSLKPSKLHRRSLEENNFTQGLSFLGMLCGGSVWGEGVKHRDRLIFPQSSC